MPPTNILFGMSVPYFGTDGEKATGVSGRDMSIVTCTTTRVTSWTFCCLGFGLNTVHSTYVHDQKLCTKFYTA